MYELALMQELETADYMLRIMADEDISRLHAVKVA